jgi:hypothetical protein
LARIDKASAPLDGLGGGGGEDLDEGKQKVVEKMENNRRERKEIQQSSNKPWMT